MFKPLLATAAAVLLAACADSPIQPELDGRETVASFGIENSGNPNSAILIRRDGSCTVYLQPDVGPRAVGGKFYRTVTKSGVVNLNCTGATLTEEQTPDKTYTFKWEFAGQTCFNRITKGGQAHASCHVKAEEI